MYPSLNPLKEKIHLFSPLCAKRIIRSNYLILSRYVSNTRDGEPCDAKAQPQAQHVSLLQSENLRRDKSINSKPIRLGICHLASGKLQVITSASTLGVQERGNRSWSWSKSYLLRRRENSFMLASVSKPSSLVVFDDAGHCTEDKDVSPYTENNRNREEQSNADHEELPLLFLHENNHYEEALKTIGAAGESGSLCQSAAAQLKDLCHHLHVEDAIWAAAKPCKDRVDDIIIRKDYSAGESCKHDYSFFFQSSDAGIQSLSEKETGEKLNPCTADLPKHVEHSIHHPYVLPPEKPIPHDAGSFSTASDIVGSASYEEDMLPVLQCVGEREKKMDDPAPSDGPSKEQLSYMHHRLSEEMPKFFEQSHDYGLYADTVHFDNRIMKVSTRGLAAYKATVQSLKYLSTAYLTSSQMELLRITIETEQHCIQARWRIKGVPLHSYLLRPWGKKHKYRYFDAFSTFYVGSDGLIHSHVLDKVMPSSEGKVVAASWAVRLGIMMGVVRPPAYEPDIMKAITLMKALLGK